MASSARIGMAGLLWVVGTVTLIIMAFIGSQVFEYILPAVMGLAQPTDTLDSGVLTWIPSFYYGFLILLEIALSIRAYQQTVVTVDYYPGLQERNI